MDVVVGIDRSVRSVVAGAHDGIGDNQLAAGRTGGRQNLGNVSVGNAAAIHDLHLIACSNVVSRKRNRGLLVGNRAGVEFMAFHKTAQNLFVKEMMLGKEEIKIPQKADLRYALCAGVAYYLWRGQSEEETQALVDGFYRISLALSSDFAAMLMMDVMNSGVHCKGAEKLYKHPAFKEWEKKHGKTFRAAAK